MLVCETASSENCTMDVWSLSLIDMLTCVQLREWLRIELVFKVVTMNQLRVAGACVKKG